MSLSDEASPVVPLHPDIVIDLCGEKYTIMHVANFNDVPECKVFAFDIEAEIDSKIINCVQVCPVGSNTVYVTSGRKAVSQAHNWL